MPLSNSVKAGLELIQKDSSKILGLTVGKHDITEPGQYVPRADAQSPPQLTYTAASSSKSYVVIHLDLDAPFPSFPNLGPILHWIQSGLTPSSSSSSGGLLASSDHPFIADYIGPAPPPLSAPHRYVFFLYEAPEQLTAEAAKKWAPEGGKKLATAKRLWANLDDWEQKLGVGGKLVAVNYYTSN